MSQIRNSHRVWQFSIGALTFSLCFYHVREVLVCWLLFGFLFFGVTLLVIGGVLVFHACNSAAHWLRRMASVSPVLALSPTKSPLEISVDIEPLANE